MSKDQVTTNENRSDSGGNKQNQHVHVKPDDSAILSMVTGQMVMVAREQSRLAVWVIVLIVAGLVAGGLLWQKMDELSEQVHQQTRLVEQGKKHIWELKTALNLKFSQER